MLPENSTVHFVAGFLGSGKTTAIVNACRELMNRGVRPAVVTNDQGRHQVDHAFVSAFDIPATAVANGCLCCRYDDFEEQVLTLAKDQRPQVIFAESVGSCADVVATVVKPFESFRSTHQEAGILTTFVDSRLIEARLDGRGLPFSENVSYIFDKQIEEAEVLVLNKQDLFTKERMDELLKRATAAFPEQDIRTMSATESRGIDAWLRTIKTRMFDRKRARRHLRTIDYGTYGRAEAMLAWLDVRLTLVSADGSGRAAVGSLISRMIAELDARGVPSGHVKVFLSARSGAATKLSFTAADLADYTLSRNPHDVIGAQLPQSIDLPAELMINARVESSPVELSAVFEEAVRELQMAENAVIEIQSSDAFVPGYPKPVHRFT
jgi:Ni2+-binding GTPase involved in maturation of urease and hydrogenase